MSKKAVPVSHPIRAVNAILDDARTALGAKNDAALCRKLGLKPPEISKLRHSRKLINDRMLIILHEVVGNDIGQMKAALGMPSRARG